MDHGEEAVGDQNIEYDGENMFEMANMSQRIWAWFRSTSCFSL